MRYVRYVILAAIAVVLITLALANRDPVTLRLLPDGLATLIRWPAASGAITVPLFVVIFGGIVLGVLLGFVWEWLREHKHRAEAARQRREKEDLARELNQLKGAKADEAGDDVLALLEEAGTAR